MFGANDLGGLQIARVDESSYQILQLVETLEAQRGIVPRLLYSSATSAFACFSAVIRPLDVYLSTFLLYSREIFVLNKPVYRHLSHDVLGELKVLPSRLAMNHMQSHPWDDKALVSTKSLVLKFY